MAATVPQLAARALRRLGVVAVAASDRPAAPGAASGTDIATRALQSLGISVPAAGRPSVGTASVTDLAGRALQSLGLPVLAAGRPDAGTASTPDLAARALQALGVTVPASLRPANSDVGSITAVANRALQSLGLPVPSAQWPALTVTVVPASIGLDALLRLAVMPADQSPSAADQALAEGTVSIVHDNLVRQGLVSWPVSAIPRGLAEEYSVLVALRIAAHFGKTPDPNQIPIQEERIKRFSAVALAQDLAEQHATAAHAALVGVGAASWDATHIPVAVVDEYVELTRQAVAPLLGLKVDGIDRDALQERVRRVSRVLQAQADAEAALGRVHAHLVGAGLAGWTSTAIPATVAEDYVALTAADLAPAFGKALTVDRAAVEARVMRAANVLRAQADAESAVQRVHARLVGAGQAGWDVSAIPGSVADDYVALTAADMAPGLGQAVPVDRPAIEGRVQQVANVLRAQADAESAVARVNARLVEMGLAGWDAGSIPAALADEYAQLVAAELAPGFGQERQVDRAVVEEAVRRVSFVRLAQPLAEEAVMATHANLAAQGKARWSIFDLPDYAEAPYVVLAANRLAPAFGQPIDQISGAAAMADLTRLVALGASGEPVRAEYF